VDLVHDGLELARNPLGIEETLHEAVPSLRPLGRFRSDLLQLPARHECHSNEIGKTTHSTWVEMRVLSSVDTVDGKMGTDGASASTVFRTTSTTSIIPSSFSIDV
jgi:hypothetical protein